VLSGGWDGHLRVWEAAYGSHVAAFRATDKQVSSCAVAPDGKNFVSGATDGMLAIWDAVTHLPKLNFLAHTRPIAAISYGPDGKTLATAAWDNTVMVWVALRSQDAQSLASHKDIVAGCEFTPDGQRLLSWAYDASVILWDLATGRPVAHLLGHNDRVQAGAIAPGASWAATGSRDGVLKLWQLPEGKEAATASLRGAVTGCAFLLDGKNLIAVDNHGRVTLHALPNLEIRGEVICPAPVQQFDRSPAGNQVALACTDGKVHLVVIEGFDKTSLLVSATRSTQRIASRWQRLFGRSTLVQKYQCTCPVCRHTFDISTVKGGTKLACAHCRRKLQLTGVVRTLSDKPANL
jgi:WD40 repeat protein